MTLRRRCYQHFVYQCASPSCEKAEREALKRSLSANAKAKMSPGAPEASWAHEWNREAEVAQLEEARNARAMELGVLPPAAILAHVPGQRAIPPEALAELREYAEQHGLLGLGQ